MVILEAILCQWSTHTVIGTEIGVNPHGESISYYSYVINIFVDGTYDLFDLQVVILEVILYQWSSHNLMGTEIGVNPHGEYILIIFMSQHICRRHY